MPPQPGNPYQGAPLPYDNSKTLAKHAYHSAVSALTDQRRDTLDYYGFRRNGQMDPNNTYGAWQMLGREQGQQITDLTNAQSQGGLLNARYGSAGLGKQQLGQARYAQGLQSQQMLKEFQDKMQAIRLGFREAKWQKNNTETSGTLQAILNAISAGQFTPAAPTQY